VRVGSRATAFRRFGSGADLADDLAGLIGALGMSRPAVFGWSTGGEVGLLLAERHPEVLSSLVVAGATAGGSLTVPSTPAIETCMQEVQHPDDSSRAQAQFVAAENHHNSGSPVDFARIRVPVLVTGGEVDLLVPVRNARVIARALGSKARLVIDRGGAHAWFVQHLDRFVATLDGFLAAVG